MARTIFANIKRIYMVLIIFLLIITIWVWRAENISLATNASKEQLPNIKIIASESTESDIDHMHDHDPQSIHPNLQMHLPNNNIHIDSIENKPKPKEFGIHTAPYDLSKLYIFGEEEYCDSAKYQLKYMDITGMYDTGTNTFYQVLTKNCWGRETRPIDYITAYPPDDASSAEERLFKERAKALYAETRPKVLNHTATFMNVKWKPLMGKHNVISAEHDFIDPHFGQVIDGIRDRLTLVIIKDPLTWFKSLCKAAYEIHFWKISFFRDRCPFFLAENNGKASANMWHSVTFSSLMELWNFWYGSWTGSGTTISVNWKPTFQYWNETVLNHGYRGAWRRWMGKKFINTDKKYELHDVNETQFDPQMYYKPAKNIPHVVIRYEDILFQPERLIERLCKCVGGYIREGGPVIQESAAKGHGEARGRQQALKTYGNPEYRFKGYSADDINTIKQTLNDTLLHLFSYQL